jgi:cold shock CspA family protein
MKSEALHKGVILSFNNTEGKGGGYGFIARPGLPDVFVHISELVGAQDKADRALYAGDQVSFEIGMSRKQKPCAVNVRVQVRAAKNENRKTPRRD